MSSQPLVVDYFISSFRDWISCMEEEVAEDIDYREYRGYDEREGVNNWLRTLKKMLLSNAPTADMYRFIQFILEKTSVENLTSRGSSVEYFQFSLNGKIQTDDMVEELLCIGSCELLRIFKTAGYDDVLKTVLSHYSEQNKYLRRVMALSGSTQEGLKIAPLEHGLFIIYHSLEFHQDYTGDYY